MFRFLFVYGHNNFFWLFVQLMLRASSTKIWVIFAKSRSCDIGFLFGYLAQRLCDWYLILTLISTKKCWSSSHRFYHSNTTNTKRWRNKRSLHPLINRRNMRWAPHLNMILNISKSYLILMQFCSILIHWFFLLQSHMLIQIHFSLPLIKR